MNVKDLVQGHRKWAAIALATVLVGGITAGAIASGGGNDVERVTSSTKAKPKTTPTPSPEPVETPVEALVEPETSTEAPSPDQAAAAPSSGSTTPRKATQAPAVQAAPAAPTVPAPAAPAPEVKTVSITYCGPFIDYTGAERGTQVKFAFGGSYSTPTAVVLEVPGWGSYPMTVSAGIAYSGSNFPSTPWQGGSCSARLG